MERISREQEVAVQAPNKWKWCRRGVFTCYTKSREYCRKESALFSSAYKEAHKDDVFSVRRQVGTSIGIGIVVGTSIVVPLYVIYKTLHGMTVDTDIIPGVGAGSVMGAVFSTYQTMVRSAIRKWNSEPRPPKEST